MSRADHISIRVPANLARAFRSAGPEERLRIEKIVSLSLAARVDDEAFSNATDLLERTMDDIGERARQRGLTDEILRDILDGE